MKIEYNNLYTHFVFTTLKRKPLILDQSRIRIEKYITGIVNNIKNQRQHHQKQSFDDEYGKYVKFYQQTIRKKE